MDGPGGRTYGRMDDGRSQYISVELINTTDSTETVYYNILLLPVLAVC